MIISGTVLMWTAASLLVAGAFVYFWNDIRDFITENICPRLAPSVGQVIRNFMAQLDRPMSAARRAIRDGWEYFRQNILRCETTYTKTSSVTATKKTETFVNENGRCKKIVETEYVDWEDLPDSVRHEMLMKGVQASRTDNRDIVGRKVAEVTA